MTCFLTGEKIKELFDKVLDNYAVGLQKTMKRSNILFNDINTLCSIRAIG